MHVDINGGMSPLSPPLSSSDPAESLDRDRLAMAGANQGAPYADEDPVRRNTHCIRA